MIDIIGHFFVLYPLITLNKDSSVFQKSKSGKLIINLIILALACVVTNMYLMDSNLITAGRKTENLYEIFETLPQDFLKFN